MHIQIGYLSGIGPKSFVTEWKAVLLESNYREAGETSMRKFESFIVIVMCCIGGAYCPVAAAQNISEQEVVASMVESAIASYQSMIVDKLTGDGFGSDSEYSSRKGFVPTADAFIRRVSFDAIARNKKSKEKQFTYAYTAGGKGRLSVKINNSTLSLDQKSLLIAKILDSMVRSIRGTYTNVVVRKIRKDGAGASINYLSEPGNIPLPAVFVRAIFSDIAYKQSAAGAQKFSLGLRSRWNLNPQQDLQDEFEREGWEFLSKQQAARLASGQSLKNYFWDPYVKTVTVGERRIFRFLSADPAAGKSCVTCHNQWEARSDIKTIRERQQVEVAKVFQRHELIGVLSINVGVDQ